MRRLALLSERAHASGRGTKGGMGKRDLNALLGVGKKSGGAKKAKKAGGSILAQAAAATAKAKAKSADASGVEDAGVSRGDPEPEATRGDDPAPRPSRWGTGVADDAPGPAPAPARAPAAKSRWNNDDEDSSDSEDDAARREAAEREAAALEAAAAPESYMDKMVREAMEFKAAQEAADDSLEEAGELPSNGHGHRQPLDKAALMTPSTDDDATPREAPGTDDADTAAAPVDTPPAGGEGAQTESPHPAPAPPAALDHPNVTVGRGDGTAGERGGALADLDDLDDHVGGAEDRADSEEGLGDVAGPSRGPPGGGGLETYASYPVVDREEPRKSTAPDGPERETIEDAPFEESPRVEPGVGTMTKVPSFNRVAQLRSVVDDEDRSPTPDSVHEVVGERKFDMMAGCRSVFEYEQLNKIDEGTYGVVFRARDKGTGAIRALKKVKMDKEREGFPLTALREANILLSMQHPNVVGVTEMVMGNSLDSIFMVMEFAEHDLKGLMETMTKPFTIPEVKCLMTQLLGGVSYLHDNWVLHRDLKTSNVLVNNKGELKICDFGLARQYSDPLRPYTHMVVTLWYRAPELLLGQRLYSTGVDVWSLGCIMGELLCKDPLFQGKTEIDQIDRIFRVLGTPNEKIWPDFVNLPSVRKIKFPHQPYNNLRKKFPKISPNGGVTLSDCGFDLMNKLLAYDPSRRMTCEDALNHAFFAEFPPAKAKELMPTYPSKAAGQTREVVERAKAAARVRNAELRAAEAVEGEDPLEAQRRREEAAAGRAQSGLFSHLN